MYSAIFILFFSLSVRLLNLYFFDHISPELLVEDEVLYWKWSLAQAYTVNSEIESVRLLERMPGSFLFFQTSFYLFGKNLLNTLLFQIFFDCFNCLFIAFIAKEVEPRLFLTAGILASISPLLIIISSQILSDTIFLFFFNLYILFFLKFINKKYIFNICCSAVFLGISVFIRATSFPLIAGTVIILFFIVKKPFSIKYFLTIGLFFIFSTLPVFDRISNNFKNYQTFSLTTQTGSHLAYWVVPGVLDFYDEQELNNYQKKLNKVNKEIEKKIEPFASSKLLSSLSFEILGSSDILHLSLAWGKGAFLNLFSPPILLDKRIRALKHPSFYESNRNITIWLKKIFENKKYSKYKYSLIAMLLTSVFFFVLLFIGLIKMYYINKGLLLLSLCLITYFFILTGPVFSPKYIFPIISILIIAESIALKTLLERFLFIFQRKKNSINY